VNVRVLDKGRGVGGRMATRRLGAARADHGAQFFTVRSDLFGELVEEAAADGAVVEWCRGFDTDDGHVRWRGANGMTDLAKWLARDLDVTVSNTVHDLRDERADAYIVTAPVPQALALLVASRMVASPDLDDRLATIRYEPTIALMVVPNGPTAVPAPGAVQRRAGSDLAFIADNSAKGMSAEPVLTLHATAQASRRLWRSRDEKVTAELWAAAAPWTSGAGIREFSIQRWRYAAPVTLWPEPCAVLDTDPPVILAGDAFGSARVEGAVCSGAAAAAALLAGSG
jgi:predicted NAD/FAD-dependent oxidoreductase